MTSRWWSISARRVGVMYLGSLVETGPTARSSPARAIPTPRRCLPLCPRPDPDHRPPLDMIRGEIASALAPPAGCKFHPRCPKAFAPCPVEIPAAYATGQDHHATCHLLRT